MKKSRSILGGKIASALACVALALGLVPLVAFAAGDTGDSPAGRGPAAAAAPEGCIMFASDEPFTVSLGSSSKQTWEGTIKYSLDCVTWQTCAAGTEVVSGEGKAVYFRGTRNTRLSESNVSYSSFAITPAEGHAVSCLGNIETLLDYEVVSR